MPKNEIYNYFFVFFLVCILCGVGLIIAPFFGALLSAFVIAVTCYPSYDRLGSAVPRWSPTLLAVISDIVVLIFLVLPVGLLIWSVTAEFQTLGEVTKNWGNTLGQLQQGRFSESVPWLDYLRSWLNTTLGVTSSQFQQNLIKGVTKTAGALSVLGASFAQNMLILFFDLFIMLFALFFFFRDGKDLVQRCAALFPMNDQDTHLIFDTVQDTVVGIVRGWLLTSVVQGFCATLGYYIVGLNGAVLFGALTAAIGLMPMIGTFAVWVPIGIYLLIKGAAWKGIFTFVWGAFVIVGFIDTFVRPYLIGQKAEMPLFYLFFALLGGVEVFGAKGIILGPLIVSIAPKLLEIYRRRSVQIEES